MKSLIALVITCFVFSFAGCSSITVKHDYDSQADFAGLKTFDWMSKPRKAQGMHRPLLDIRIKNAVNSGLQSKGLQRNSNNPDFLIAYHAGAQDRIDVDVWGYRYGRRARYYGWSAARIDVQKYTQGTLILDFVDARSKELIWRGVATSALPSNPTPEKMEKKINDSVIKMLEKFPPMDSTM